MILSRRKYIYQSILNVGNFSFERVDNFKYPSVNINISHNIHNEVHERISDGNKSLLLYDQVILRFY